LIWAFSAGFLWLVPWLFARNPPLGPSYWWLHYLSISLPEFVLMLSKKAVTILAERYGWQLGSALGGLIPELSGLLLWA